MQLKFSPLFKALIENSEAQQQLQSARNGLIILCEEKFRWNGETLSSASSFYFEWGNLFHHARLWIIRNNFVYSSISLRASDGLSLQKTFPSESAVVTL